MVSALPGFGGHVPEAIERIIPDAELTKTADWSGFSGNLSGDALLQPADPHFVDLGTKYYKLLIEEFGTDHMFQMDTFNEMQPSYTNMTLLRESNAAVYRAMVNADPEGVYIMQGWLFHESTWACVRMCGVWALAFAVALTFAKHAHENPYPAPIFVHFRFTLTRIVTLGTCTFSLIHCTLPFSRVLDKRAHQGVSVWCSPGKNAHP